MMSRFLCLLFCSLPLIVLSNVLRLPADDEDMHENDHHQWINLQVSRINSSNYHLIDWKNLMAELTMMAEDRSAFRIPLEKIIIHLLKMVCYPTYPNMHDWLKQIFDFREQIQIISEGHSGVKADLRVYKQVKDKRTRSRELTHLEKVLDEEWSRVVQNISGQLAYRVWFDSDEKINFTSVPEKCPLTLDQVLDSECFPRKRHYGPDLKCFAPSNLDYWERKLIKLARTRNETIDEYYFQNDDIADVCPEGFY